MMVFIKLSKRVSYLTNINTVLIGFHVKIYFMKMACSNLAYSEVVPGVSYRMNWGEYVNWAGSWVTFLVRLDFDEPTPKSLPQIWLIKQVFPLPQGPIITAYTLFSLVLRGWILVGWNLECIYCLIPTFFLKFCQFFGVIMSLINW